MTSLNEGKDFSSDVKLFSTNQKLKINSTDQRESTIVFNVYVLRKKLLAPNVLKSIDFTSNFCVLVSDESKQTSQCH